MIPEMDSFTAGYLANLASALTGYMVDRAKSKIRRQLKGTEEQQALRRCIDAGLYALLSTASAQARDQSYHLSGIFERFFTDERVGEEVGEELALMLFGEAPDMGVLRDLFEMAGYDADSLAALNFNFEQGMVAFRYAFLLNAVQEPLLQPVIQAGAQITQTGLQRDIRDINEQMLDTLQALVALLHRHSVESLSIQAGHLVSGTQVIFQWPRFDLEALPSPVVDWEQHYLEALIARCDPLDLTPIDETQTAAGSLDSGGAVHISQVFTTLYLVGTGRREGQSVAEALRPARKDLPGFAPERRPKKHNIPKSSSIEDEFGNLAGPGGREEERHPIQALEAVGALERLVILGQPGGGKSTLVNYLATQLARRRLGQVVELPTGLDASLLPARLILRRFAAWLPAGLPRGRAGLVWDYLAHQLETWGLAESFATLKQRLLDEGGVIFFDGLDEVREQDEAAKRTLIKEAIEDFAAQHRRCRMVVTCREYAYNPPRQKAAAYTWRLAEPDFPVVELALFDLPQIEQFTQTWYRIVGPQKGWDESRGRSEAANLYQAVESLPHLRELAQYPLLLTLMAQVHGRDGYLPQDRADLYERAVNLLLAHWENRLVRDEQGGRRVEPSLVMRLGIRTETLRQVLERVAFEAHDRQERDKDRAERAADIPREDLRDILGGDLGSIDRADQVIAYIQERAGLLQARDNRTYAFPHRTFQEYLAAKHLLKQGNFAELLRERIRRDLTWWREVFLLASGAARETTYMIALLINTLLPTGPKKDEAVGSTQNEQAQLAGQALYETRFIDFVRQEAAATEPGFLGQTYRHVQQWLEAALISDQTLDPRERAEAGRVLARLGDSRPGVGLISISPLPEGEGPGEYAST